MQTAILTLNQIISDKLIGNRNNSRKALSLRYPILKNPIIASRRINRTLQNYANFKISKKISDTFFENVAFRHQSLLMRKLGNSDPGLQKQKITNLSLAAEKLNGLVIKPGQIFSFWHTVGKPSRRKGYVNGMLLSNGQVTEGIGGGLCQMSNLLFWMFLHMPVEITERYHHSKDVFPDSGRVLPFGSGATILYNFIDLKIKNTSPYTLQLKIWLSEKHLKGQILSTRKMPIKFHVYQKNHCFLKYGEEYYRFNEIWRQSKFKGELIKNEKLISNFAPVHYEVTPCYLQQHSYRQIIL